MAESADVPAARHLALLLRCLGVLDLLAFAAVIMPFEWMSQLNAWCGMGPLPPFQVVSYLSRTTSALYALHGAMLIFMSCDVRRYLPLIRFLGWMAVVHAVILLAIDVAVGMPLIWTLLESPGFGLMGAIILTFERRCRIHAAHRELHHATAATPVSHDQFSAK